MPTAARISRGVCRGPPTHGSRPGSCTSGTHPAAAAHPTCAVPGARRERPAGQGRWTCKLDGDRLRVEEVGALKDDAKAACPRCSISCRIYSQTPQARLRQSFSLETQKQVRTVERAPDTRADLSCSARPRRTRSRRSCASTCRSSSASLQQDGRSEMLWKYWPSGRRPGRSLGPDSEAGEKLRGFVLDTGCRSRAGQKRRLNRSAVDESTARQVDSLRTLHTSSCQREGP
jgi:hypothetical protein